ncbi:MAG: FAD-binding oxidoreductase [Gammaproteobacteria bacterium]|nr:FAD-binding oxidoreductase [Gammaproteobacteria bacterium]
MFLPQLTRRDFLSGLLGAGATLAGCRQAADPDRPRSTATSTPGTVVMRDDPDFELWRTSMPWQLWKPDRQPDSIVRPESIDELAAAVQLARDKGWRITSRSGGHHVWGAMLRDDGMLIDMSRFREVRIDPEQGFADVGPAVWSDRLNRALAAEGLAFPVAHCASVPMGGYLMGGGFGLNGDEWGAMACFSVLEADVMTADGELLTVGPDQHEDLYWAVRGAGHGFPGIVSRYRLRLYPAPQDVRESVFVFPAGRLPEVGDWLRSAAATGMPNTELMCLLLDNPDAGPDAPPAMRKLCIARPVVFADSSAEAEQILAPLTAHPLAGEALFTNLLQPNTMQGLLEGSIDLRSGFGFGRYAVDTAWTNEPADALATVAAEFASAPSPKTHVVVLIKGNSELPEATALSRLTDTWIGSYAVWDRAEDTAANVDWLRQTSAALKPFAAGHSINELDAGVDPGKIERSFTPEAWARLEAIRAERDPDGRFHGFLQHT